MSIQEEPWYNESEEENYFWLNIPLDLVKRFDNNCDYIDEVIEEVKKKIKSEYKIDSLDSLTNKFWYLQYCSLFDFQITLFEAVQIAQTIKRLVRADLVCRDLELLKKKLYP